MRIDEQGRWVSDDGFYVWDESVQTWMLRDQGRPDQGAGPATGGQPVPGATTIGADRIDPLTGRTRVLDDPLDAATHDGVGPVRDTGPAATTVDPGSTTVDTGPATAATAAAGLPVVDDTATWDRTVDGPGGIETVAHGGTSGRRPRPPWLWPSVVGVLAVVAAVVLFLFLRDNGNSTAVASPTATGRTPTAGTTGVPSTTPGTPVPSSLMPGSPSSGASGPATAPASPGGATPAPGSAGTWTGPVEQTWLSSCAGAGGDQGYCRCTLKQLQQRFTQDQFLAFNADPESARTKAALQPVYVACMPSS